MSFAGTSSPEKHDSGSGSPSEKPRRSKTDAPANSQKRDAPSFSRFSIVDKMRGGELTIGGKRKKKRDEENIEEGDEGEELETPAEDSPTTARRKISSVDKPQNIPTVCAAPVVYWTLTHLSYR